MSLHRLPIWLIDAEQDFCRSAEFQELIRSRGFDCRPVKFFPERKQPGDIVGAESIPLDARVVYFGGPALMEHIQRTRRWRPGGWCTFANFNCDVYYSYFGKYLLNHQYALLPACEAVRQRDWLFQQFSVAGEVFIRPSIGRKIFVGTCVERDDFSATLTGKIDPRSLVIISSPKSIQREWRLFVAHDRVVATSQYANCGKAEQASGYPSEIVDFASEILRSVAWRPDPLFAMDICESGGHIFLLELNGFSCSNLYQADLQSIVSVVSELAEKS